MAKHKISKFLDFYLMASSACLALSLKLDSCSGVCNGSTDGLTPVSEIDSNVDACAEMVSVLRKFTDSPNDDFLKKKGNIY